jgi:hypothetical protein
MITYPETLKQDAYLEIEKVGIYNHSPGVQVNQVLSGHLMRDMAVYESIMLMVPINDKIKTLSAWTSPVVSYDSKIGQIHTLNSVYNIIKYEP